MMKNGRIYQNTLLQVDVAFSDADGVATDPSSVTFMAISPCGRIYSYVFGADDEIQKQATGSYLADITPDEAGRWSYRWQTTGPVFATEDSFIVLTSPFVTDCYRDYV